eukprot:COSAG06_NODE_15073_length_1099_cov_1.926000_1_plen_63_part_10
MEQWRDGDGAAVGGGSAERDGGATHAGGQGAKASLRRVATAGRQLQATIAGRSYLRHVLLVLQ